MPLKRFPVRSIFRPDHAGLRRHVGARFLASALAGLTSLSGLIVPGVALAEAPTLLDLEAGDKPAPIDDAADKPAEPGTDPATGTTAKPAGEKAQPSLLDEMDPAGTEPAPAAAWDVPTAPPPPTFPYVEYHGYFRFRPDLIANGHLGFVTHGEKTATRPLTTSAILPPLSLWPANNDPAIPQQSATVGAGREENTIAGANMRFRLAPTLHLADTIRIQSTLDIFDNHVFGSAPDYAGSVRRPDVPLVAFATSTQPGAIAVKEVYGEWKTLLGLLRVGRMSSQWGLGILADGGNGNGWDNGRPVEHFGGARLPHEGSGYDSDFGTYADRVAFLTKIGPLYASYFYDFVSEGIVGRDPTRVDGQPRDLEQEDDVHQHGLVLLSKPLSAQEVDLRKTALLDEHKAAFDYGVYLVYRTQELDQQGSGKPPSQQTIQDADGALLMVRKAWAGIADAWARYERRLDFGKRIVVEAEFASIFGAIEDANSTANQAKGRDIFMWGGAVKAAWQNEGLGVYLDVGAASGDDTRCFGVYGDPDCSLSTAGGVENKTVTGFKFHKNYRVGSLLFRDVIGAVTNAIYVRPTVSINAYPFYAAQQLGVDLSVMYAQAVIAEGTPGNGGSLGTELEARGILGQRGLFQTTVSFAYLLPGDAFNLKKDWYSPLLPQDTPAAGQEPDHAWRLMANLALMF